MSTFDDLLAAYERLHGAGPEFGGDEEGNHGLTNHGPMAVEVMVRRGLDIPVEKWLDRYVDRLDDLPAASRRIDAGDWRGALGDHRRVGDWTAYFREELRRAPWHDVLTTWWPRLLPGIAAGSTHGVIRVGHAVRTFMITDHHHVLDELANGLAFWAARWRPITTGQHEGTLTPAVGPVPSAAAALETLPRLADQTGFIAHRLSRLHTLPEWPGALGALRVPDDPDAVRGRLTELIDAATLRYLAVGRDAPVLLIHTATAPNAVLHCLPVLPQRLWRPSLAAAWTATAAITVMYAGRPDTAPATVTGADIAGNLLDRAGTHRDEHVLKFADTAAESYARTGDRATIAAAHLAADLIATPET